MTTYYIDKRNQYNGDGSLSTPAISDGAAGAYNSVDEVCESDHDNNSIIQFVAGSGPYYPSDFNTLVSGKIYMRHEAGTISTIDLGGNALTSEIDMMDGGYDWVKTTYGGDDVYYATALGGGDPAISTVLSGIIDGVWDAQSTSLFGTYTSVTETTHEKKWGYGDEDSLGFDTVYVRGVDPTSNDCEILVSIDDTEVFLIQYTDGSPIYKIQNGTIRGGGQHGIRCTNTNKLITENIIFENMDSEAASLKCDYLAVNCVYRNCGHQAFDLDSDGYDAEMYHCYCENIHVIKKLVDAYTNTITVRNCSSKNLLAGAFQHDSSTMTLVEDHNQFHLDLDNIHGGDALAFTGGTRQWLLTDTTDLPASTDTSLSTSEDPIAIGSSGKVSTVSPCVDVGAWVEDINDQGDADPWGKYVHKLPNIGVDQGAGTPSGGSGMLTIGGGFGIC